LPHASGTIAKPLTWASRFPRNFEFAVNSVLQLNINIEPETQRRQVTVVQHAVKLSLILPIRPLFTSSSPSIHKAAGSAFNLASRSVFIRLDFGRQTSPSNTHTRGYASNKDKKTKKMPPKKQVKEEKILLGRPGNSLKSGIVCENMCVCLTRLETFANSPIRSVSPT